MAEEKKETVEEFMNRGGVIDSLRDRPKSVAVDNFDSEVPSDGRRRLVAPKNLAKYYPDAGLTLSSIRWMIFNKDTNGFDSCMSRMGGRKIVIDLDKFELWVDGQ